MRAGSTSQVHAVARAVFVSYASEDAEVAQSICKALRAAGIEVWFDQSELRGGDSWDREIRKQIRDCALFIPIISATTQGRREGYFRREWKLAVDRTHDMSERVTFLLPVVVDGTPHEQADVPDSFQAVQWTSLPDGVPTSVFVERVLRLLSSPAPIPPELRPVAAERSRPAAPSSASVNSAPQRKRHLTSLIVALATIGAGYFALETWVSHSSQHNNQLTAPGAGEAPRTAGTQTLPPPERSVAVLPFTDMSEKQDQGYFADGVAEELVDLLTQVPELRVAARTSSFFFKGRTDDVATIAQKLRVANLLEGSVRRVGDRLRVTVQLVHAADGYEVWSRTYQRSVNDIFQVQDEIAAAVVEALKIRLLPAQHLVNQHHTTNLEAYAQYLLGDQLRARDTPETNAQALAAYQKAVALDPGYAAAYSGLAVTEWRIADQSTGEVAAYERAAAAADKAIALAPASADGYWARGHLRYVNLFDWRGAREDLERALALDARDVRTLVSYGRLLATLGRIPDAISMTQKALDLDPLSVEAWDWLSYYFMSTGQLRAAQYGIQRELQINPAGTGIETVWNVALLRAGPQAALAALPKHFKEGALFATAVAEHSLGHTAESQRALDILIHERANTWAFQIACIYAWRGEGDRAFEWLERAYRQRDTGMTRLTLDPLLAGLRGDPRYKALVRKMNLPI